MEEQTIRTSEGCPYSCPFCFQSKTTFKDYKTIPEIKSNKVFIHDEAFLSKKDVIKTIYELGSKKVNGKVVYYELTQGINLKDLHPNIAFSLKENRFINIRFAWDDSYTKKSYYRVYDGIKMLKNAGYKDKDMICYIISNYYVSLTECLLKAKVMLHEHIPICNCRFKKYYLDSKVYPELWNQEQIDYFTQQCRINNQIIKFGGYDPEIEKRLSRAKALPSAVLKEKLISVKLNKSANADLLSMALPSSS